MRKRPPSLAYASAAWAASRSAVALGGGAGEGLAGLGGEGG